MSCSGEYMCMVAWYSDMDPFVKSGSDPNLCSLWTRYIGDSKISPWDNPKICISSYSEDQMAIWIQNCVISCECLLLYHFIISRCQYYLNVTCIISFDHLIYVTYMITHTISYDISDCTPYVSN